MKQCYLWPLFRDNGLGVNMSCQSDFSFSHYFVWRIEEAWRPGIIRYLNKNLIPLIILGPLSFLFQHSVGSWSNFIAEMQRSHNKISTLKNIRERGVQKKGHFFNFKWYNCPMHLCFDILHCCAFWSKVYDAITCFQEVLPGRSKSITGGCSHFLQSTVELWGDCV